jgi:4a-hydroxytetrahydrobiopterin dehydratase
MERPLTRQEASDAVNELGWRFLLGALRTSVPVRSLAEAAEVAVSAVAACWTRAGHLVPADERTTGTAQPHSL